MSPPVVGAPELRILRFFENSCGIARIDISAFFTAYPPLTVKTPDLRNREILQNFAEFLILQLRPQVGVCGWSSKTENFEKFCKFLQNLKNPMNSKEFYGIPRISLKSLVFHSIPLLLVIINLSVNTRVDNPSIVINTTFVSDFSTLKKCNPSMYYLMNANWKLGFATLVCVPL